MVVPNKKKKKARKKKKSSSRSAFNATTSFLVFAVLLVLLALSSVSFRQLVHGREGNGRRVKINRIVYDSLSVELGHLERRETSAGAAAAGRKEFFPGHKAGSRRQEIQSAKVFSSTGKSRRSSVRRSGRSERERSDASASSSATPSFRSETSADFDSDPATTTTAIRSCSSLSCGDYGVCVNQTRCECLATHTGGTCSVLKHAPTRVLKNKEFHHFTGHMTLNKKSVKKGASLEVRLLDKMGIKLPNGKVSDGKVVLGKIDDELWDLLPDEDLLVKESSALYNSCAIVGSSGIVHHFSNGANIDGHEMVFRFNSAPTKGFEKLVGTRTTFRITNSQNWAFREEKQEGNRTEILLPL